MTGKLCVDGRRVDDAQPALRCVKKERKRRDTGKKKTMTTKRSGLRTEGCPAGGPARIDLNWHWCRDGLGVEMTGKKGRGPFD